WQGNLNDLYTLVHELGHSLHSYHTTKHQPFRYGNYSIFVAEVASTCNEALLSEYLLNNLESDQERLFVLNHSLEGFRGTVLLKIRFAESEHHINLLEQNADPLTADKDTEIYYDVNKNDFSNNMVIDKPIGYEWARILHFYMTYYVYQYATGYSAATS